MSFCVLSEWLWAIHHEDPMSQLTAHIHNRIQGEWECLCGATALHGESIKDQHTYNHVLTKSTSTFSQLHFKRILSSPFQPPVHKLTISRVDKC